MGNIPRLVCMGVSRLGYMRWDWTAERHCGLLECVVCVDIVGWSLVLNGRRRGVASSCDQLPPAPVTSTFPLSLSVPSHQSRSKSFLPWVALVRSFISANQKVTTWRSSRGGLRGRLKNGVMSKKRLGALSHSSPLTQPAWLHVVVQRNNLWSAGTPFSSESFLSSGIPDCTCWASARAHLHCLLTTDWTHKPSGNLLYGFSLRITGPQPSKADQSPHDRSHHLGKRVFCCLGSGNLGEGRGPKSCYEYSSQVWDLPLEPHSPNLWDSISHSTYSLYTQVGTVPGTWNEPSAGSFLPPAGLPGDSYEQCGGKSCRLLMSGAEPPGPLTWYTRLMGSQERIRTGIVFFLGGGGDDCVVSIISGHLNLFLVRVWLSF
jgi:hypothetical protein